MYTWFIVEIDSNRVIAGPYTNQVWAEYAARTEYNSHVLNPHLVVKYGRIKNGLFVKYGE